MKKMQIVFRLFFIVSLLCIFTSIGFSVNQIMFISKATSINGTVISLEEEILKDNDDNRSIVFKPVVRFQLEDGREQVFVSTIGSNPPIFKVGSSVNVLYDSNNPQKAKINSFITLWFFSLLFLFLGAVFIVISIIGLSKMRNGKGLGVSYSIQFSLKELFYLLFHKKICPNCNGTLIKARKKDDNGIGCSTWNDADGITYSYGQRYNVTYIFTCDSCGKTFDLKQLMKTD